MKMKYKMVLFDYGGTLDDNGVTWRERFYRIYQSIGLEIEEKKFDQAFYKSDDFLLTQNLRSENLKETLHLQIGGVLKHLDRFPGSPKKLINFIAEKFIEDTKINIRENKKLLQRLKTKYILGIVSNFYGNLETICEELGLKHYFRVIIDSSIVGHTKPDREIFELPLRKFSLSPDEAVFVGDSLERDMAGAHSIGMNHILLTNKDKEIKTCCPQVQVINKLSDLKNILC